MFCPAMLCRTVLGVEVCAGLPGELREDLVTVTADARPVTVMLVCVREA